MLDYLKEKRDAGFFKSLSGLMQSCRYSQMEWIVCVCVFFFSLSLIFDFLSTVSWIWMHLRGRIKQRDLEWWQRKVQVSKAMPSGASGFYLKPDIGYANCAKAMPVLKSLQHWCCCERREIEFLMLFLIIMATTSNHCDAFPHQMCPSIHHFCVLTICVSVDSNHIGCSFC